MTRDRIIHELRLALGNAAHRLTQREHFVLVYRFGLFDNDSHSLRETADLLSVTPERIRQIEAKALRKVRTSSDLHHRWPKFAIDDYQPTTLGASNAPPAP